MNVISILGGLLGLVCFGVAIVLLRKAVQEATQ
jgi:LPS O-antigen subunit length determinant protein (WzzB/FepE family)